MDPEARSGSPPERSLSTVLKGRRRKQALDDSPTTLSLHGNDSLNAERGASLLRSSIDRGIDKLKDRASRSASADPEPRRNSQDSGTGGGGRRLSKLVSSSSRRRRKEAVERKDTGGSDQLSLSHAPTDASLKTTDTLILDGGNQSSESLLGRGKSAASSLLTEDSDPESASRPALTSRPSHVGYLTLSSPLIAAETVDPYTSSATGAVLATSAPPAAPPATPAAHLEAFDQPSDSASDADHASTAAEQRGRGRTLGDAAGASSAISTSSKSKPSTSLRKIDVAPLPRTDSSTLTETPSTLVTPPTPEQAQYPFSDLLPPRSDSLPAALPSFSHRRVKSAAAGPSKLSVANAPPLTPALEEVNTPGGSLTQPGAAGGGFFSSLFSTTQNAVTQISNTFTTAPGASKGRSLPASRDGENIGPTGDEEVIITNSKVYPSTNGQVLAQEEPAVATLGSGDLKLSHLGISEVGSDVNMSLRDDLRDDIVPSQGVIQSNTLPGRVDESSAAEAVPATFSDKPVADATSTTVADRSSVISRPKSISSAVGSLPGDATPPRSIANGVEETPNQRSGSVRSRISDRRKRHRNNSTLSSSTPSAIAAALVASHSVLANPAARVQRLTGYPIANPKRNKDFHNLFRSVPEDDYLIEDYSAALQREILLHGRLYISERHICFSSNIMGWITNLVVSFDEVVALEKKNTAMIFPNAIVIQTLHAKNIFASLINRDGTYDLLLGIWKVGHPNLKATETGHVLDSSVVNTKAEAAESMETDEESEGDDEDDDEDADENGAASFVEGDGSVVGSDIGDSLKGVNQRVVSLAAGPGPPANGSAIKGPSAADVVSALDGFPGPASHAPTDCSDHDSHLDKLCLDDTIPAPLGKVYSMLFGPLSGSVMRKFLEEQESGDIQYEDDKKGLGEAAQQYSYSFIKKLGGAIGPKQTRCLVDQSLEAYDLQKAVSVICSTQTPDVPSGSSFVTKTRYCLMWGPNNSTRILMTCATEWSGKSFLRGAIDKGAEAGQQQYGKDIAAFLKAQVAARSPVKSLRTKGKGRKKKTIETPSLATNIAKDVSKNTSSKSDGGVWGLLGLVREVLGPVGDILGPLISPTIVLGTLLLAVTFLWLRQSYGMVGQPVADMRGLMTPQRLAAYEQLWRREENELWTWLEDRINLDELTPTAQGERSSRKQALHGRDFGSKLEAEKMNDRQIHDAIRVTEERLDALKAAIDRKKSQKQGVGVSS